MAGVCEKRCRMCFWDLEDSLSSIEKPCSSQDGETISNAFKTACMLHNMLLEYDGLNEINWENT